MDKKLLILEYVFESRFNSDIAKMADLTGYEPRQIQQWLAGEVSPQNQTLDFILTCGYVPEFRVVKEFFEIDSTEPIRPQLAEMYAGHEELSGVYSFYDASAKLLYVGKAKNLLKETYEAIRRSDDINFPAGIKNRSVKRYNLVRYISAYDVATHDWWDYPKHVESLILRISKPPLNKQIGTLEEAFPNKEEGAN